MPPDSPSRQPSMPGVYQRGSFEEWAQKHGASLETQLEILHQAVADVCEERDELARILALEAMEIINGADRAKVADRMLGHDAVRAWIRSQDA